MPSWFLTAARLARSAPPARQQVLFLHRCLSEPPPLEALQQQFEAALAPLHRLIMLSISENGLKVGARRILSASVAPLLSPASAKLQLFVGIEVEQPCRPLLVQPLARASRCNRPRGAPLAAAPLPACRACRW